MIFQSKIDIDGGIKSFKQVFLGLISGKAPGYSFYTSKLSQLTADELLKLRKIPFLLPDALASKIGSKLIGREVKRFSYHNIIPTISRQQIGKALSGNITTIAEIVISHQQLGTGTTAPANGDTALQTPSVGTKKTVSSMSYSSNQVNITSFWAANEATGTWREFGLFIDTTVLFNRVAINITVATGDALTLDGTVLIS